MTRRDAAWTIVSATLAFAKVKTRLGCSTSTWDLHPSNFAGLVTTVAKIKTLKYHGFATSFRNLHFGPAAAEHARQLGSVGLKLAGVWMEQYAPDGTGVPDDDLVDHVANGCILYRADRLIVHSEERESPRQIVQALIAASRMARRNSIDLAYSPAAREFANGGAAIDTLLEQIEAKQLRLVLDTAQPLKASANPVEFFNKHHKRIDEVHLRDIRDEAHAPLGTGTLDLKGLAGAIEGTGWNGWLINGEEPTKTFAPPDQAASAARDQVQKVFGL